MTVKIPIVTTYDGKGAKQAQKSLGGLNKSVISLGKTLGVTLSAAAIIQFGKASVKAFLDDDKAAKQLSKTLDNLGIAFESPAVADFIAKMERATGVADDYLRPAFSALVVATHDATKAQEMLSLALDVSAGTGKDLGTVTAALQKAYLGNSTALSKLGAGLTKSELATNDFAIVSKKLADLWGGSATASAKTYAGQLAILARAGDNAKESIGKGLVDAVRNLSKGQDVTDFGDKMQSIADNISYSIIGFSELFNIANRKIESNSFLGRLWDTIRGELGKSLSTPFRDLTNLGQKASIGLNNLYNMNSSAANASAKDLLELRKKEIAAAEKLAKLRAAENNKSKKVAADQLTLKKASAKFDLDQIQITAALKGKITEEERIRLELQMAILQENAGAAEKLQKDLEANQLKTQELAKILSTLPKADDPFADWPSIIAKINGLIKDLKLNVTTSQLLSGQGVQLNAAGTGVVVTPKSQAKPNDVVPTIPPVSGGNANAQETPNGNQIVNPNAPQGSGFNYLGFYSGTDLGNPDNTGSLFDYLNFYGTSGQATAPTINVYNAGSVLSEQDLTDTILQQLYVRQGNGTGIQYNSRVAL